MCCHVGVVLLRYASIPWSVFFFWADVALLAGATRIGLAMFEFALGGGELGGERRSKLRNISGGVELFFAFNQGPDVRKSCPNGFRMRKVLPWHACVSCPIMPQR